MVASSIILTILGDFEASVFIVGQRCEPQMTYIASH